MNPETTKDYMQKGRNSSQMHSPVQGRSVHTPRHHPKPSEYVKGQ